MRKFFNELKRRGVLSAIAYYAAAGWLLVQVATQVLPFYNVHDWVVRGFIGAVVVGFPIAIIVAWFYKWTPGGWLREVEVENPAAPAKHIPFATDASIAVLPFDDLSAGKDQDGDERNLTLHDILPSSTAFRLCACARAALPRPSSGGRSRPRTLHWWVHRNGARRARPGSVADR